MKKFIAKISLVALVLMTFGMVSPAHANPDGINDIKLDTYWVQQSATALSIFATVDIDTTLGTYAAGDSFTISASNAFTGGLACPSPANYDLDNDGTTDSCSVVNNNVVWTMGNPVAQQASLLLGIPVDVPTNGIAPGTYYMEFEMAPDASGAIAFGVGVAGNYSTQDNVVQIKTSVSPTVTLNISDTFNAAAITTCDLGFINEASLSECSYNVHAGSNLAGGTPVPTIQIRANADGSMTDGGVNSLADAAGTACVAGSGTECYGMVVAGSNGWGGTAQNNFDTEHQTVPSGTDATVIASQSITSTLDGALGSVDYITVTHAAVAGPATVPSTYSQDVTWTAVVYF